MLFSAFSFFTLLFVKNKFSYFTFLYLNKTANRNCKDKCISHVSVKSFLFLGSLKYLIFRFYGS